MRLLLFCWVFAFLQGKAQIINDPEIHPLLKRFVEPSQPEILVYDQQKTVYAFIGKLPTNIQVLRKLSDIVSIIVIPNQTAYYQLQQQGKLFAVNQYWKLAPDFIIPTTHKEKQHISNWIIQVTDTKQFVTSIGNHPAIKINRIADESNAIQLKGSWQSLIDHLLNRPDVVFIGPSRTPSTERELTGFDLSANNGNLTHRLWPTITGKGLTVSIKENKMDTTDIDFRGRYLYSSIASTRMETHATTMATIAAGAGNTFYTGKGMAWGASISSSDFSNLLPDPSNVLQQLKVSVQNHSYGTGIENYYGADAAAYDQQMYQNPTLLHVFSAGNLGTATSTAGNYASISGFANLTGSFKMSKNSMAVGAMDSFGIVPPLSSRGPVYDGRVKPELIAFGEDGTSGAAAIVSGIAILVQQAWQTQYNQLPLSAAVRAILCNSADDIGSPKIDYISGYGIANSYQAIKTVMDKRVSVDSLSNQQQKTHRINIPANAKQLKLTISWTDPAAQANSFKAIVNDLDLVLRRVATNQEWQPWVLSSFPHIDSLQKNAVRKKDSLNTNEQITIDFPLAGEYDVLVKGFSISSSNQVYALAWQIDTLDQFIFTYPVKGDQLDPGRKNLIRWQTTISDTATLQYRINNGNWQLLSNGIDLSKKYYHWLPPDTIATVQFRVQTLQRIWMSDTVGISKNLLTKTGFNCTDSFLIYWQKEKVDSYHVYRLGQQYLEKFAAVKDTALIQLKQNNPYTYFAIAPVLQNQLEGQRSYTFDYTQQQVACYISGFIADPFGNNAARISLQLGTTYQVTKIVFEKLTATGFQSFREITPVTTTQFTINEPTGKGMSTYRARIELNNGTVYYTQAEQVIQFADQAYYVFPNPVKPGMFLNVLVEDPDNKEFRLYDLLGRLLMKETLIGFRNQLRMPLLQRGIYFYTILQSGDRKLNGRLIVQ